MGPIRSIEEAMRSRFNVAAGRALHDRVLTHVRRADDQSKESAPALNRPDRAGMKTGIDEKTRIEDMNFRLDVQRQNLLDRFLRMETALSTAQRIMDSIQQTTDALYNSKN